ncbi:MAG: HAMP domain-containing histidine kinase [Clostridia bacterium]|nr:HAMP domain-containing histidine kinase [Clostridia bacterium]
MSKYCYRREDGIVYFKYLQKMTVAEIDEAYKELGMVIAESSEPSNVLTDVLEFDWNFGNDVSRRIAQSLQNPHSKLVKKSATVVSCAEQKFVAQNVLTLARRNDIEIFYDIDEAIRWLLDDSAYCKSKTEKNKNILLMEQTQDLIIEDIRTIEERQRQLIENERLISLGQLIGGIAHNLNTPLMTSGAGVAIIERNIEKIKQYINEYNPSNPMNDVFSEMKYWLGLIMENLKYMSDMIAAVKGQAKETITPQNFTIEKLVTSIKLLMEFELKRYKCKLDLQMGNCDGVEIKGDINSLIQVLNTIMTNALEASTGSGGKRKIILGVSVEEKTVTFYVENYGKEITPEVGEKIFKKMVTTKGKNGTGIGLYIAGAIVKGRFGGDIYFNSREGITTFFVKIPLEKRCSDA